MFKLSIVAATALVLGMAGAASAVTVQGTANPYLAGSSADTAPPMVEVKGEDILNFTVAGLVGIMSTPSLGPDGGSFSMPNMGSAEYGISAIRAPGGALVGVFLDDSVPVAPAPAGLSFGSSDLDFASLSPDLWQIFFIGDGLNASGAVQNFITPDGATRLFLGIMDSGDWSNNSGSFEVTVSGAMGGDIVAPVPLPAAALLLLSGLGGLVLVRRRA